MSGSPLRRWVSSKFSSSLKDKKELRKSLHQGSLPQSASEFKSSSDTSSVNSERTYASSNNHDAATVIGEVVGPSSTVALAIAMHAVSGLSPATPDIDGLPSQSEYVLEATKRTIDILKGAAGLVPIPLMKEVLNIGLSIIATCEALNEVQERVQALKNRIAEFLLVVAKVATNSKDESNHAILMGELRGLKECLTTITDRLEKINQQNAVLLALFPQPNHKIIDQCVNDFQHGIDKFQTLRSIHDSQDLSRIQSQLEKLYGLTKEVDKEVRVIKGEVQDVKATVGRVETSVDELRTMMKAKAPRKSVIIEAAMPEVPQNFYGRDTIVARIAEHLASGDISRSRVCILGPGGMGKTSTAVAVMQHPKVKEKYTEYHRFWVPCLSANSPGAFLAHLAEQLRVTGQRDRPLPSILDSLKDSDDPRIILLDNFETIWHPTEGSQEDVKKILRQLNALPHVAILVTMRSEFPPLDNWVTENLLEITLEDSRRIYTAIDPTAEHNPELDKLLKALGYLPYAVTLMATRGKRSSFDPGRLLEEWNRKGTAMLSHRQDGMDRSIQMSIEDPFFVQTSGALELLQVLSLLPAGVYSSDLQLWASPFASDAVDILRDTALVVTRNVETKGQKRVHMIVLPVVQTYMCHGHIPDHVRNEVYRLCFNHLCNYPVSCEGPNDDKFKANVGQLSSQEANIQALVTDFIQETIAKDVVNPLSLPYHLDALIIFCWYQHFTRPQAELPERVVELAGRVRGPKREAEALFCYAQTLYKIQRFEDARTAFQRAAKLFSSLNNHNLGCRSEVGGIKCLQSSGMKFGELDRHIVDAYSRWGDDRYGEEIPAWLALIKANTSRISGGIKNEDALALYQSAQATFSSQGKHLEAAICLQSASKCFAQMGDYRRAIEAYDEAAAIFERLGLPSGIFRISKVRYLKGCGNWGQELLDAMKAALQHSQEYGSPMNVAQALEEFAELYVRQGDWAAARLAYDGALEQCKKGSGYTLKKIETRCQSNLKFIEGKEKGAEGGEGLPKTPSRF